MQIQRILCPIDFSDHSRRALDQAIAIARRYGATITAPHVFSPDPMAAYGPYPVVFEPVVLTPTDRDRLRDALETFVAVERAPGVVIRTALVEGTAAAEIVALAASLPADLIVMGTHGRSGFERLLLGSVAEKVLRKAGCPVLTVPKRMPDAMPLDGGFSRRILCPVDFSGSSLQALTYAWGLAQEYGARLDVVHVMAHGLDDAADAEVAYDAGESMKAFLKASEDALAARLRETVRGVTGGGGGASQVIRGKPWREILRLAGEHPTDLIVMGVQGRGAADLFFFGSTAQHVVRQADCPVLTLRGGA